MNIILGLSLFAISILIAFFVLRYMIKWQYPNLGRIVSSGLLTTGVLLDQLNVLPWGQILSEAEAKITGFVIVLGMALLHTIEIVKKDGQ